MSDLQEKCAVVLRALNDWAVTYAPDMCDEDTVAQAKSRILEHGTLAYIADASEKMREVIAALSEADQLVKDARRVALEEAAKLAEAEYKMHCTGSGFDSQARSTSHRILEAIRALQSEERKSWRDPTIFDDAEGRN